jgi:hypothetical protein
VNKRPERGTRDVASRFVGNFSTRGRVVFSDGVNRVIYGRNHLSQTGGLNGRTAP